MAPGTGSERSGSIGQSVPKIDAVELATGRARFVGDLTLPRMLHGKILRSRAPHARLVRVDTSRAERLAGVKAVITAADLPDVRYGFWVKDMPCLARDRVRYAGEAIAAVGATDPDIAEEALDLVEVEYEDLPAVFDVLEAVQPEAPLVHQDVQSYAAIFDRISWGNVVSHSTLRRGDVREGFARSDEIFEDWFRTPPVHQAYIEPHVALAEVDSMGSVTVWASTQRVFLCRQQIAEILRLPLTRVRVIAPYIGGGFGGKEMIVEPIAVRLAQKSGRPVRMVWDRQETFTASRPRHGAAIYLKTGVRRDGTLVAREARLYYDTGAYADAGPGVSAVGALFAQGPYNVEHVQLESFCVYTNKVVAGAYRAYGNPQIGLATELQMDLIAERLGLDPVQIRLKNAIEPGSSLPTGQVLKGVALKETILAAVERLDVGDTGTRGHGDTATWGRGDLLRVSASPGLRVSASPRRGRGIACMVRPCGVYPSCAFVKVNEDGTFSVLTGITDLGTGAKTVLAQIAADELGVPIEDVRIVYADSETTPFDFGSVGSRVTYSDGGAVWVAANEIKRQLLDLAATQLEANPEDLVCEERSVCVRGSPGRRVALKELARPKFGARPIVASGTFMPDLPPWDRSTATGYSLPTFPSFAAATEVVDVEVELETGAVRILNVIAAQDVGRAINPVQVEGQIVGGLAQGLGYALCEEYCFDQGVMVNPSFADYKVPSALDMPPIELSIVEVPDPGAPHGAKGAGEPSLVPVAPAIASAIHRATGVWIKELPLTPERIWRGLKEAQT